MTRIRLASLALGLLFLTSLASAAPTTKVIRDNLGRKVVVDAATLALPGAGGDPGTFAAAIVEEPAPLPWEGHFFDVAIGINVIGTTADQTEASEQALTGLGIFYIPKTETGWFAVGPRMSWAPGNGPESKEITFEVPTRFTLFPSTTSAYRWNLYVSLFSYTVRTGTIETPRSSAWSFNPTMRAGWEIPRGAYSVEPSLGLGYPLSIQGITDQDLAAQVENLRIEGGVTVYWRQR